MVKVRKSRVSRCPGFDKGRGHWASIHDPICATSEVFGQSRLKTVVLPLTTIPKRLLTSQLRSHRVFTQLMMASIAPGTVLIVLAGRFMGKRVVFLKQLSSGFRLVIGPFNTNGVPPRRVDQSYVIATSTKVDISGVNVEKFDDNYLAKKVEKKKKKEEGQFFDEDGGVNQITGRSFFNCLKIAVVSRNCQEQIPSDKKEDQKAVDSPLMKAIEGVTDLKSYLGARFTLKSVMKPHELVF
ncbi:60S RIBOSOMAL PROTEIN L6 [Salix purpurea]|uniref:60S RIBOSOMAL PROTEIN L6 n=1 Tax=Salix purpurea TaxID=77065 RepID=A0A9Q0Q4Z0_SALPP|nr:60S RIBOSOMAL PROTEIN L6 [Salix purpurea]